MSVNFCPSLRVHFDGGSRGIIFISQPQHQQFTELESQALAANNTYLNPDIVGHRPIFTTPYCGPTAIAVVQRLQTQIDSSDGQDVAYM